MLQFVLQIGAVALAVAAASGARASEELCDPSIPLEKSREMAFGYRPLQDRCEGVYAQHVGAATLRVVGFTADIARFQPNQRKPVSIAWPEGLQGPVRLRAKSLKTNIYYQMDTVRPESARRYAWPTNLLSRLSIQPRDLGIAGWVSVKLGSDTQNVYLPLQVSQGAEAGSGSAYWLILLPGRPVRKVSWRIFRFDPGTGDFSEVPSDAPRERRVHSSGRGVPVRIEKPPTKGIYHVEIIGELAANGLRTSRAVWFYHPGA